MASGQKLFEINEIWDTNKGQRMALTFGTVQDKRFFTSPLAPACSGVRWKGLKFYIPPR